MVRRPTADVGSSVSSDRYLVSSVFDFLLLGGGSLLTYALLITLSWDQGGYQMLVVAGWLSWVVNWPHFSATLQRLSHSTQSRKEFPLTVALIPLVISLGMVASLAQPELVAPYFVKLYLIWSPYHFSGQTVGVTLIYARRNGMSFSRWGRLCLSAFVFSTFIYSTLEAEVSPEGASYFNVPYPGFGVPPVFATIFFWIMVAAGFAFLFHFFQALKKKANFPWMVLLPGVAQLVWFVFGRRCLPFYALVPFFHSLQYLPLVWAMQIEERRSAPAEQTPRIPSIFETVRRETLFWYFSNVLGGIGLFHILPKLLSFTGVSFEMSSAVLLSGIQLHHFFVDGVMWKLRSTRVNRALTRNVRNLFGQNSAERAE